MNEPTNKPTKVMVYLAFQICSSFQIIPCHTLLIIRNIRNDIFRFYLDYLVRKTYNFSETKNYITILCSGVFIGIGTDIQE